VSGFSEEGSSIMEKCKINGKAKRLPTDKGACPECTAPAVKLTGKGFVASHPMPLSLGEGPQVPITDEGARVGDPRDAAVRREVESLHQRARGAVPGPEDSVPDPVVTTGHGRGPVLVRGRNMPPVQPQSGYAAAAGTMAGPIGRERFDRECADPRPRARRSKAAQRRYRAHQTAARIVRAEGRGVPQGKARKSVAGEVARLREAGKALPTSGW
jgi:hypothetical protein